MKTILYLADMLVASVLTECNPTTPHLTSPDQTWSAAHLQVLRRQKRHQTQPLIHSLKTPSRSCLVFLLSIVRSWALKSDAIKSMITIMIIQLFAPLPYLHTS